MANICTIEAWPKTERWIRQICKLNRNSIKPWIYVLTSTMLASIQWSRMKLFRLQNASGQISDTRFYYLCKNMSACYKCMRSYRHRFKVLKISVTEEVVMVWTINWTLKYNKDNWILLHILIPWLGIVPKTPNHTVKSRSTEIPHIIRKEWWISKLPLKQASQSETKVPSLFMLYFNNADKQ